MSEEPGQQSLEFHTVDVFTRRPFHGAQIAVFPYADGLDRSQKQAIAREFNLTETAFVSAADRSSNQRCLEFFSPTGPLEFGGHPIIGVGHVLASIGDLNMDPDGYTAAHFDQNDAHCEVHIESAGGKPVSVQFSMPVTSRIDQFVPTTSELAMILGLETTDFDILKYQPLLVSSGHNYLIVPLRTFPAVRKARFNFSAWGRSSAPATLAREILLFTPQTGPGRTDFHGRLLGPDIAREEDPPIGSAMPAFAAYLSRQAHIKPGTHPFTIDRGTEMTRHSQLDIELVWDGKESLSVRVGGPAVMMSTGQLNLGQGLN